MSLASLARLARTATYQVDDGRALAGTAGQGGNAVDGLGEEEREESNPRYSTASTLEYYLVRDAIIAQVWGGEPQGQTSVIQDYINDYVERRQDGAFADRFPNADELLNDPEFLNGAWATRFRAAGAPSSFVYTDESGQEFYVTTVGNPGIYPMGVTRAAIEGTARPGATGVDPVTFRTEEPTPMTVETTTGTKTGTKGDSPKSKSAMQAPSQDEVSGITMNDVDADRRLGNRVLAAAAPNLPTFNTSDLAGLLSGGGGGGGGGGGRQSLVLDEEALKERTRQTYRRWYRQDPDDPALDRIVSEYSRKANAFWVGKGGQLDFEVFMRERLREEPQYNRMFRFRPPSVDEDSFVSQFEAGIGSLGLRASSTEDQIARGMQSGGSAESQMLRASRTREASGQAGFARRLGSTVQQLGRLG